jgi:hypothetical protein
MRLSRCLSAGEGALKPPLAECALAAGLREEKSMANAIHVDVPEDFDPKMKEAIEKIVEGLIEIGRTKNACDNYPNPSRHLKESL